MNGWHRAGQENRFMVKRKIMKHLFFIILCSCVLSAQNTKTITPKTGNIVFLRKKNVDNESFDSSSGKFRNALKAEAIAEGITDTAMINQVVNMTLNEMKSVKEDVYKAHFKFMDSVIVSYKTMNNKVIGDYTVIDRAKGTYTMLAKKDSLFRYMMNSPYEYSDSKVTIKEYPNETKIINGYKCFKIIVAANDFPDNADVPAELKDSQTITEMWVTRQIQCLYHPVIRYKDILQKYYPLEISESGGLVDGVKLIHESAIMSLK